MSKKQFSIRLEQELYDKLDNYRWEKRKSLNEVISEALKKYIDEIKEIKPDEHTNKPTSGGK